MKDFENKLKSRRGASILLAMIVLLVTSMVAAVLLSAGVTAARRVADDRTEQQAILAADSAARMLRLGLEASSCTVTYTNTRIGDGAPTYSPAVYAGSGPMGFILVKAAEEAKYATAGPYTVELTPELWQGEQVIASAQLSFTMERYDTEGQLGGQVENYLIAGTLTVDGSVHRIYLTGWVPTIESTTSQFSDELEDGTSVVTTTTVDTLRWNVDLSTERRSS